MKKNIIGFILLFVIAAFFQFLPVNALAQFLKSLVYDFDGLDINQSDLPEGDYRVNDLSYSISAQPLSSSDMLGDRALKLNLAWKTNYGAFGRGISRYIEFNPDSDFFNFFFYNPESNFQSAILDVVITDDDNQSNTYESASDDSWKKSFVIPGSSGWQFFSARLRDFTDGNSGGNGIFDIAFTQNKGMLLMIEFRFTKPNSVVNNPVFYLDMINFSDGPLPHGATIFDLPLKNSSDYCRLGAYQGNPRGSEYLIPSQIEGLFPQVPGKKLKYANFFLAFALDGTTVAKELPGNEVQILLDNGYVPVITWEPLFKGYDRLDSRQPRLSNIINGDYDNYIDKFADKMKTYTDTVIIRFMHEFEGNWYPWSLTANNQDPDLYVAAFRRVVDRFRARGATKVKWMWCLNSDYFPYRFYNWVVPAYPGDNYVDIVASDIYNNHYPPALPWWRSFRWQCTESYYYLHKYFPGKPHLMCELGCRERLSTENPASESKAQWYARMDKELQSNYHEIRALIFFNGYSEQNWLINSSPSALQSLTDNIWFDDYYFGIPSAPQLYSVITSPAGNSLFSTGSDIVISATASGGTGSFQKIEFFANAIKLGEDLTSPYDFTWNNVASGNYQLTARVIDSNNDTAVSAAVNITVSGNCSASGFINREVWNNISGYSISSIPVNTTPASTNLLTIFEAPSNVADNYGQRIRGYVCPPLTGNYIFWIASDDNSELWLSSDSTPADKTKICSVSGWTGSREWTKYSSQQSAPVYLFSGQKYYIEALHKEGAQGDNLAVGWQLPGGTFERPVPAERLSHIEAGINNPPQVTISSPSNNSVFISPANIIIDANASDDDGTVSKVNFYSGPAWLGEDVTSPYSFSWANVPAGNYSLTAIAIDNSGDSGVSSPVLIRVVNETSCDITGKILREFWANISGYSISSIPVNTTPTSTGFLNIFEAPSNVADYYGQRIRGYVCPPLTGNYSFWVASDDNSELWLSSDSTPYNKTKICFVSGWTGSREWTKYSSQQSTPVYLFSGQKYYIEALHKEGAQGDHLAVGWQLPLGTMERPIPGMRLSEYVSSPVSTTELVIAGANWKYLDNGTNQGTAWRNFSFNDSLWNDGNAELGYGDGDEATVISYGPSLVNKYITTYFRKKFSVSAISGISGLELSLVRDDGAVVYLNGAEIYRAGMPSGTIYYNTLSTSAINGPAESKWNVTTISAANLIAGDNVMAVEIHQQSVKSSDLSFNLKLQAISGGKMANATPGIIDSVYQAGDIIVYPNPTTGSFTLEYWSSKLNRANENNTRLEILNSTGQIILAKNLVAENDYVRETVELDKGLSQGIYLMNIISGDYMDSRRIILNR